MSADKISAKDLLDVLDKADLLDKFCLLPAADQDKFSEWIGKARDVESHWRRIDVLVAAMRAGPLTPPETDTEESSERAAG